MTYSPNDSQNDSRERRPDEAAPTPRRFALDSDEWVAILVAFGVIGTIFFWSLRPSANGDRAGWLTDGGFGRLSQQQGSPEGDLGGLGASGAPLGLGAETSNRGAIASEDSGAAIASRSSANRDASAISGSGNATSNLAERLGLGGAAAIGGATVGGALPGSVAADPSAADPSAADPPVIAQPTATPAPATSPAPASPFEVASEDLETSIPAVAANSWVAPFAASLTQADRFGELPATQGAFDVDAPITRAEFASLIKQAEQAKGDPKAAASKFADIEESFWGAEGISGASNAGFMSGYSTPQGLVFRSGEQIPRWQVFVSLASGLKLAPPENVDGFLSAYDTQGIPDWAKAQVAATINAGLAINADASKGLEGARPTTRGEATAMLQQALQRQNKVGAVDASKFVVKAKAQ